MRLRLYDNMVRAQQTADFLLRQGVAVRVFPLIGAGFLRPRFELILATRRQHARAEELLSEFESEALVPEENWEAHTHPDLARLDPARCAVTCASCARELPHDIECATCPSCGHAYDLVERILEVHGPDVLLDAFEDDGIDAGAIVDLFDWRCEKCDYSLAGLPRRDRCPECGNLYDKDDMFRKDFR